MNTRGRILDKTPGQRQNLLISLPFLKNGGKQKKRLYFCFN